MPRRVLAAAATLTLLAAGIFLAAAAPGSRATVQAGAAVSSQMTGYVDEEDDAIALTFADGTNVGAQQEPGPVIPPGTYQVSINDLSQVGDFDIAGNGVSFVTGVEQRVQVAWTITFQPCSLYSYRNDQQAYIYWFQTSAAAGQGACPGTLTGMATTTLAATTAPKPVTTKATTLPPGERVSAIGTVISTGPLRGTIHAVTSRGGITTLSFDGKATAKLKPGRYTISVSDGSTKAGLFVRKGRAHPLTISSGPFVGKRSVRLDLSTGRWTYSASSSGAGKAFTVGAAP